MKQQYIFSKPSVIQMEQKPEESSSGKISMYILQGAAMISMFAVTLTSDPLFDISSIEKDSVSPKATIECPINYSIPNDLQNILQRDFLIKQIKGFADLEQDWDGYGADKTNLFAIGNAVELVGKLPIKVLADISFSPTSLGGILFRYEKNDKILRGEISGDKLSYYYKLGYNKPEFLPVMNVDESNIDILVGFLNEIA